MIRVRPPRPAHDAPRPRAGVRLLAVGGEAVLADPEGGLHHLNATGALVWRCLDGRATLAEIAGDVAAVTGLPVTEVLADLARLTDQLDAAGLLEPSAGEPRPVGVPPTSAGASGRRTLDEPGSCIPCGSRLARLPWSGLVTLGVGDYAVGVRTHPEAATTLLAEVFAPLVLDDEPARDNFSLRLAEPEEPGPDSQPPAPDVTAGRRPRPAARPRHLLYRADRLVGRAGRPEPLLATLGAHLAALDPPAGLVPLDAVAVCDDRGRAVLCAPAPGWDVAFTRTCAAAGLQVAPEPPLWDPDAGRILLGAPGLPVRLPGLGPGGIRHRAVPVALVTESGADGTVPAPAAALVRLAAGRVPPGAAEALARLTTTLTIIPVDPTVPARARAARLAALLGDADAGRVAGPERSERG